MRLDLDFDFDPAKKQIYTGAVASLGPMSIEGFYDSNGVDMGDGLVGSGLGVTAGPAEFGAEVEYDLLEKSYSYEGDAYVTFAPVGAGISLEGSKASNVELVCVDLDVIDYAGLDLAFTINQEEAEILRGIDVSAYVSVDVVDFRVGYLSTEFGEGDENAPAAPQNGGVYAVVEVSY